MLQLLPQNDIYISDTITPEKAIEYINSYVDQNFCENISIDISHMNILDACQVSVLCSSQHYIKYPQGKINWKVSSELVSEFVNDLKLGNSVYTL